MSRCAAGLRAREHFVRAVGWVAQPGVFRARQAIPYYNTSDVHAGKFYQPNREERPLCSVRTSSELWWWPWWYKSTLSLLRNRHVTPEYGSFLWICSKLEIGSFRDSLFGWRKEAAGGSFHVFSSSTFPLLRAAWELQNAGVQIRA